MKAPTPLTTIRYLTTGAAASMLLNCILVVVVGLLEIQINTVHKTASVSCPAFNSYSEVQAFVKVVPRYMSILDKNKDGIACNSLYNKRTQQ